MSVKTGYELKFERPVSKQEREDLALAYAEWEEAVKAERESEEQAHELIMNLLEYAGIEIEEVDIEKCDQCDEVATEFWPNLKTPVQMCESCEYNARRSGWEPGR